MMPVPEDKTHKLFRDAASRAPLELTRTGRPRIQWTPRPHDAFHGTLNGADLFYVSKSSDSGFVLVTALPVPVSTVKGFLSADDAKAHAENMLDQFVRQLGAQWPAPPSDSPPVAGESTHG